MKKLAAGALVPFYFAACISPATDHPQANSSIRNPAFVESETVKRILSYLELRSVPARPRDISAVELMYDAPGQSYDLNGDHLFLHPYPTMAAATQARSRILVGANGPDWVKPPTFLQCDEVIALYAGESRRVLGALAEAGCIAFYSALPPTPRR